MVTSWRHLLARRRGLYRMQGSTLEVDNGPSVIKGLPPANLPLLDRRRQNRRAPNSQVPLQAPRGLKGPAGLKAILGPDRLEQGLRWANRALWHRLGNSVFFGAPEQAPRDNRGVLSLFRLWHPSILSILDPLASFIGQIFIPRFRISPRLNTLV